MREPTLLRDGYASYAYPATLRTAVENAAASWQRFCALSDEQKRFFSRGDRLRDFGYMRRDGEAWTTDRKELFHITLQETPELMACAKNALDPDALTFITDAKSLIECSFSMVEDFASMVDWSCDIPGFAKRVLHNHAKWTLRYLHYLPGSEMLAMQHVDRKGITLHLYESTDGGEFYSHNGAWEKWPLNNAQTIMFPGMEMQYASECKLKALCHRVIANDESRAHGRYAMVLFVDFDLMDSGQAMRFDHHMWPQKNFSPGFNYHLPFSEFKKLFIPL